jgi:hypothetical protein
MKTKQSILVLLVFSIVLSFGTLSCHSVKTAVDCPEISIKKTQYKAHRKIRNSHQLFAQKARSDNQKVSRTKQIKTKDTRPAIIAATLDENIQISKAEFTKGFIASVDNTVYPAIQSAPVTFLPLESIKLNNNQINSNVQDVKCDTIYLRSGVKLIGKVEEIGITEIKYRHFNNLTGPLIAVLKSDVSKIHYPNGAIELFAPKETIVQNQIYSSAENSAPPRTEGLGLAGFISSLAGLFIASIPLGTIAIIFGAVSLSKINKDPKHHKGKGFAIASIVIGLVDVLVMIVLLAALL